VLCVDVCLDRKQGPGHAEFLVKDCVERRVESCQQKGWGGQAIARLNGGKGEDAKAWRGLTRHTTGDEKFTLPPNEKISEKTSRPGIVSC